MDETTHRNLGEDENYYLRDIVDADKLEDLHSFISDVLEMAHESRCTLPPPTYGFRSLHFIPSGLLSVQIPGHRKDQYHHMMKNLDDDKSWQLLLKTALFGSSDEEFPKQLKKKGREMLMRKCGGLPLAIKEVGRQWAEKRRSGSEWEQVVESSIDSDLSATLAALESTYLNLNPEMKSRFLRLAFFKEGTTIRANRLVQICTAGGLEEEQSKDALSELATESIIIITKTCGINAVFHRLSIRKAEDEIGFEIPRKDGNNRASHEPRNRVIQCSREKFNYSTNQEKHLVSLFFHGGGHHFGVSPSYWNHFELNYLRYLIWKVLASRFYQKLLAS